MSNKFDDKLKSSDITPESAFLSRRNFSRRNFIRAATLGGTLAATSLAYKALLAPRPEPDYTDTKLLAANTADAGNDPATPYQDITSYNNYYEFTTDKYGVARRARNFKIEPYTLTVDGLVSKPKTYALDDLIKLHTPEDRIYRFRCVEGWSMVIPWLGLPLSALLKDAQPLGTAAYIAFQTFYDAKQMPYADSSGLQFPYVEGLRLDEAMHPLTLLATGIYGKPLLPQNGAPLRLVVPWKYGFKSIKSVVKITLTEREPPTTWNLAAPREYGFYSNVNPEVDHPRWSQATERRTGEFFRRPTLLFNGYAEQVASLYAGMNLTKNF